MQLSSPESQGHNAVKTFMRSLKFVIFKVSSMGRKIVKQKKQQRKDKAKKKMKFVTKLFGFIDTITDFRLF